MAKTRPAVVTIMGHVDHGKTTLLDKIRESNLTAKESGGITQHIGAYQIEFTSKKKVLEKITFIDTPGHAAFAQMRSRGAQATDLAILVVAADEGVQEQTKESLAHIEDAKIPYFIAITKIDLPKADAEKVKEELMELGIELEELGGNIPVLLVSGTTGKGVEDLLEAIIAFAKKEKLKAEFEGEFQGIVIESSQDSRKGILNTILVKNGTLRVKDEVVVDGQPVTIKAMFNDLGKSITAASPADPIEVLGFPRALVAGSVIGSQITTEKKQIKKEEEEVKDLFAKKEAKLPYIIKADTQGTLEAVLENLPPEAQIVYSGIGEITDSDVFLAQTSKAEIIAFRSKVSALAVKVALNSEVTIREFKIIYELLEEVEKAVLRMFSPDIEREVVGQAEVIAEFEIDKKRIAGSRVTQGEINRQVPVTLKRGEEIIGEAKISSMKHLKEDLQVAKKGQEFGASFSPSLDFKIGDDILSYKEEK